ncbi:MAG TPA: hypothetical protein VEJ87_03375 [Acidimicrobiales bacterium]|nr:hypothetical protein [Acidimicrobiales bacterium]
MIKRLSLLTLASMTAIPLFLGIGSVAGAVPQNVNLSGTGKHLSFSATSITVPIVTGANCTKTDYSFSITNKTSVTQQLELKEGSKFVKQGSPTTAGTLQPFCISSAETIVFSVKKDHHALLTVTAP